MEGSGDIAGGKIGNEGILIEDAGAMKNTARRLDRIREEAWRDAQAEEARKERKDRARGKVRQSARCGSENEMPKMRGFTLESFPVWPSDAHDLRRLRLSHGQRCAKVSEGRRHCYAEKMAHSLQAMGSKR